MNRPAVFLLGVLLAQVAAAELSADLSTVVLDNGTARLTVNRFGGAISSYVLTDQNLNPFSWKAGYQGTSRKMGFFTCFDRLGKPSQRELERGVPFHGEATSVEWEVLERASNGEGLLLKMQCRLPIAKMLLVREYCLLKDSAVCRIKDRIKNENPTVKFFNILQHPSLAAPFLDQSVLVDCNGEQGFINSKVLSEIPGELITWPTVNYRGAVINQRLMKPGEGFVSNYLCEESAPCGWGCVSNPKQQLLVGCLWNTDEYPWIRVWREWNGDQPQALGIEFSTTPLGIPLEDIRAIGDLLGHPTIESLEPGAETIKTFYLFLAKISTDYAGVKQVEIVDDALRLTEQEL
jgi:hypothetical protein